ncbi:MAG TPA: hypothetical protein VJU61_27660, partial [Polyangiaceae bacterium]|nr:hypothetical protein [Polyangiaceae bacterium]
MGHVHEDRRGALCLTLWLAFASTVGCSSSQRESGAIPAPGREGGGSGAVASGGEICGNVSDDDGDGEPDCSDPDCLAVVADPTQPVAFADT